MSSNDLLHLDMGVSSVPSQVAAILWLEPGGQLDLLAARRVIGTRAAGVARLRQRLVDAPLGCGRPVWVDDPSFDPAAHVTGVTCPPPGDEAALLAVVAELVTTPLPRSRPLWQATYVDGLKDARAALVLVLHHVVADGIGGLDLLGRLVDGGPPATPPPRPRRLPDRGALLVDAFAERWRRLRGAPAAWRGLPSALRDLGGAGVERAPRTSLTRAPTGPRRRLAVVRHPLPAVQEAAHRHGATVNDVILAAVGGALGMLLADRGETTGVLDIAAPVAARRSSAAELGNHVGILRLRLPTGGPPEDRLRRIAALTRVEKSTTAGASSARLLGPIFRLLAAARLLGWFVAHQRLTNTLVTNVRGPAQPATLAGAPISHAGVVVLNTGNMAVCFGALSYAGDLAITIVVDPDLVPEIDDLAEGLRGQLQSLASTPMAGAGARER